MFGRSLDDFIGTNNHDVFPKEIADRLCTVDEQVCSGRASSVTIEFEESTSGEPRWRQEVKFALPGPDGQRWLAGVSVDVTEKKVAKQKLSQALQELQRLRNELEAGNIELREEIRLTLLAQLIRQRTQHLHVNARSPPGLPVGTRLAKLIQPFPDLDVVRPRRG